MMVNEMNVLELLKQCQDSKTVEIDAAMVKTLISAIENRDGIIATLKADLETMHVIGLGFQECKDCKTYPKPNHHWCTACPILAKWLQENPPPEQTNIVCPRCGKICLFQQENVGFFCTCGYKSWEEGKNEKPSVSDPRKAPPTTFGTLFEIERNPPVKKELDVETIAAFLHEIWSGWFIRQHDAETLRYIGLFEEIAKDNSMDRWLEQSNTPYEALTEEDKEKDRVLARQLIKKIKWRES